MKQQWVNRLALLVLCAAPWVTVAAKDTQLNVYNWSDYIAKDTVQNFTKQTGVKVRYDNYDSDDTLQAKLLTGNSGYDIVVPTTNYAGKQIAAGIFMPLDKSKLPNLKYLDPALMALVAGADPGNTYSVPWAYGTTGLGYNVTKAQQLLGKNVPLDSWDVLFKPENLSKLKACGVSVLDAPDQVFAAALHYLGRDPMSSNPDDYRAALALLKTVRPFITQFNSSGYINDLVGGDVCFAYGFSGDVVIAKRRALEAKKPYKVEYYIPKGGAPIWFDVMAIPKDAPHKEAALAWINYIETPQVHAAITNAVFYPNANLEARKYVNKDVANDPAVYPPPEVIKTLFLLKPLPPAIQRLQTRLWTELKSGR
ncbi:polyamine ABC transporter substrate-binding protein [Paraburkholderia bonniea]|uniref:polyamine ABC transporter substrate-binding protein n=1 Tax=Paraburkholderia bonniea TaxID=2152891 RepID=UPI001291071E|nr:polyamine ABC transporter substrate-binding protein [Paraburkholderia bonniea]WJF89131.1 polyamine ABC transporter substrate-binding protein [Paraburkholderia bonniea]WJF92447.1 polyamine ABC transporter substrate-binding protein [Paraburkholderia bonniea]